MQDFQYKKIAIFSGHGVCTECVTSVQALFLSLVLI